ncbi:MAG: 16S rRNA (guanine(527)-N(7))-methyltransferase RsmG [Ignavibacteria bacterium]
MEKLKKFLEEELHIDSKQFLPHFEQYEKLLLEKNRVVNLVSRKLESIEAQILNSIFFLTLFPIKENSTLLDGGTGGGFPGIPLKILRNDLRITLNDSIQKKVKALEDIVSKMRLNDVQLVHSRIESIAANHRLNNKFDYVIFKAVSTLDNLYYWSKELLANNGMILAIKGGDISSEIDMFKKKFPAVLFNVIEYHFDFFYNIIDKKLVVIKKNVR